MAMWFELTAMQSKSVSGILTSAVYVPTN